jgi:3'-phosphoadenosine 5'-phosphosulfate sulfotransferase (PAPS reductase)/FAD synthetase
MSANWKVTPAELALLQSLPLEDKIKKTKLRIREWYEHWCGSVYISFSGGKDSTVLLHIARELYPDIPAVFCDTGLEYPEIREFVASFPSFHGVTVIRPEKSFYQVIQECGYPILSKKISSFIERYRNSKNEEVKKCILEGYTLKNGEVSTRFSIPKKYIYLLNAPFKISSRCCDFLKKNPFKLYEKQSGRYRITGMMASEGDQRTLNYMKSGCNNFSGIRPSSNPLGFWTEQDILHFLKKYELPYAKVYGDIVTKDNGDLVTTGAVGTGCMFCMFGIQFERENRFMKMQKTHPKLHKYCIDQLGIGKVLDYLHVNYESLFNLYGGKKYEG